MAFLAWRAGPLRYALGLARLAPAALAYLFHRDRGRLKAAAVREFLRGVERTVLVEQCRAFAASPLGRQFLRPDAEQCWNDWRARGARMTIVSASPEEVVAPFADRLGADDLIATKLDFDEHDRARGGFDGENCRGPEKVRRLQARFGQDVRLAAAYGDTAGDREMLALAQTKGYRVFTARSAHGQENQPGN